MVKPYCEKRLPITRPPRSFASLAPNSARFRACCAMCSVWPRRTRRPSFTLMEVDAISTKRFDAQTGANREVQRKQIATQSKFSEQSMHYLVFYINYGYQTFPHLRGQMKRRITSIWMTKKANDRAPNLRGMPRKSIRLPQMIGKESPICTQLHKHAEDI